MSNKRELFQAVLDGNTTTQVPVGFWFHFYQDELVDALGNQALFQENVEGHRKFIEAFQPDFIKLMSDGYFIYPNPIISLEASDDELKAIQSIGENHPWIEEQVELVKSQRAQFIEDIFSFYNIFAPATYLKFAFGGDAQFVKFVENHQAKTVQHVLDIVSNDIAILVKRIIQEGGADGIYYSTQNIQSQVEQTIFETVVKPSDLTVLKAAQQAGGTNILHICGYEGAKNQLNDFKDYPAAIVNWATAVEGVSLAEGSQIFPDKVLLGGFGNTVKDVIYNGTKAEIQAASENIIQSLGTETRFLLGADCTVPRETPLEHLEWVREVVTINN